MERISCDSDSVYKGRSRIRFQMTLGAKVKMGLCKWCWILPNCRMLSARICYAQQFWNSWVLYSDLFPTIFMGPPISRYLSVGLMLSN